MGKAVEKEEAQAIRDGHRLPKSPCSQDVRWGLVRMGLRGEQAGCTWEGEVFWVTAADASLMCQVSGAKASGSVT